MHREPSASSSSRSHQQYKANSRALHNGTSLLRGPEKSTSKASASEVNDVENPGSHSHSESTSTSRSKEPVDASKRPNLKRSVSSSSTIGNRYRSPSSTSTHDSSTARPHHSSSRSNTPKPESPKSLAPSSPPRHSDDGDGKSVGENRTRPIRIKHDVGIGGRREISHASLGKLIARLTDAHQYDIEFRDVFLLTYRCFCTPYDFIKKLMKRYTAVLTSSGGLDAETLSKTQRVLDEMTREVKSVVSVAKSDINTTMEAQMSIMRLLSVLKYWIKESTYIELDLQHDRRSQKKLHSFLTDIQVTTPITSIRQHAENLMLSIGHLARQRGTSLHGTTTSSSSSPSITSNREMLIPPPPPLQASISSSSITDRPPPMSEPTRSKGSSSRGLDDATQAKKASAMSKLKLTRSSSDSRKEKNKVGQSTVHEGKDDRNSPITTAPKILRGVTTGSADANDPKSNALEDVIYDTLQRARISSSRNSSRTSYENSQPLTGMHPQDIADQLTLIEAEGYFGQINWRELTNKAWSRETKYKDAPHMMALIELFDATAEWVSSEILHPKLQASERAKLIMVFIDAATYCYQMNNFNTLFELTTGLSAPCIRQLNTTWGLVTPVMLEKYDVLTQVCSTDDNYRNYRQAFALAEAQPRLPCSFILAKDLFTLEEAMQTFDEDGLVNWQKFRKIHKVISESLDRDNLHYIPTDGSTAMGISRKGKGVLRHDRKVQVYIRHRLETIRKDSSVLYQLARNANTQESILFVNSLSEAGFL